MDTIGLMLLLLGIDKAVGLDGGGGLIRLILGDNCDERFKSAASASGWL